MLDRAALEASPLADLHAIASELTMDGYRRLRKADLIDAIIARQEGEEQTAETVSEDAVGLRRRPLPRSRAPARRRPLRDEQGAGEEAAAADASDEEAARARRRPRTSQPPRSRRPPRKQRPDADEKPAREAAMEADEKPAREAAMEADEKTARKAVRETRDKAAREEPAAKTKDRDEVVEGVVELLPNGSGFIRVSPPDPSDRDVYISAAQAKRCELVSGDVVSGPRRPPQRSERFASLFRIDTVNGKAAADFADRGRFDDLAATFPTERFRLGSEDPTSAAIEWLTPFGRGSRVAVTGGSWAGKSHALRLLATALAGKEGVTLLVTLVGVRPEELPEWAQIEAIPNATAALSFASSADAQDHAVELAIEQARRVAVRGEDAVVLIDTLDGLHPLAARKALRVSPQPRRRGIRDRDRDLLAAARRRDDGDRARPAVDRGRALPGARPDNQRHASPGAARRRGWRQGDRPGARAGAVR